MPGIPLLNLGSALGGLAGGFNQARSQGLQQAIQQLALQQYQGQTNQQTLANLALKAGLLNQPGGGQTPLQVATGAMPNQTAPAPAQTASSGGGPQVSPSSGIPMPQGYTYTPPAPMSPYGPPSDSSQAAGIMPLGGDPEQANPSGADAGVFDAADARAQGRAEAQSQTASSGGSDATQAQKSMPTITATPGQIAPGGIQSDSGDGGQGSGGGSSYAIQIGNGPSIPLDTFFQRTDYQKLAQGIERLAPPGTSQADIYGAVVDLAKLAEGDKTQQQQAGLLLRALIGGNFRMAEIGEQGAIKSGQITQQGQIKSGQIAQQGDIRSGQITQQGQQRSGLQTQKDTAAEQRQKERLAQQAAQFNQRLQQTSRIANTTAKDTQLRALLGDIDKQLNPGGFAVPPQGDELLQLQRERVQIVNELRKLQGLPPVPMPQAPATQ